MLKSKENALYLLNTFFGVGMMIRFATAVFMVECRDTLKMSALHHICRQLTSGVLLY